MGDKALEEITQLVKKYGDTSYQDGLRRRDKELEKLKKMLERVAKLPKDFQLLEFSSPQHPLATVQIIVPKSWGDGYSVKQALHVLHAEHRKFYDEDFKP